MKQLAICIILVLISSTAWSQIYLKERKKYTDEEWKIHTDSVGTASSDSIADTTKTIDTHIDYDIEKYFNTDMTEAERMQAKQAIQFFTDQISEDTTNLAAYLNRGAYWANMGLHVPAIEDYNKAIALDTTQAILYYNRALSKARFMYTYDSCVDLKKANDLGFGYAGSILDANCGRYKHRLFPKKEEETKADR